MSMNNNRNPFVLTSVLPRVTGLEPGARVETLELSVGSLYVGTSGIMMTTTRGRNIYKSRLMNFETPVEQNPGEQNFFFSFKFLVLPKSNLFYSLVANKIRLRRGVLPSCQPEPLLLRLRFSNRIVLKQIKVITNSDTDIGIISTWEKMCCCALKLDLRRNFFSSLFSMYSKSILIFFSSSSSQDLEHRVRRQF